ncbi:hypothetical protein HME7025_01558 [Aquirufa nivalisilvae]|uniref:Uncharacterized protein n=2 Tax=Aquirufa nivalisilvae TaxID=2516557 RepID=A0A2S2DVN0_9BACT|nr:hypothetical protein [Aquirufa nivalisilvae]AWL09413.1 hypothetical protein HME7025_01558 [Aquirufa nivalisilvae]MCZ2480090.1 hypothetical protein [Aquirufa nivalisilvae]
MKFNSRFLLFISIFFFMVTASMKHVIGITQESAIGNNVKVNKTEQKELSFFNLLFEEDRDNTEEDDEVENLHFDFSNFDLPSHFSFNNPYSGALRAVAIPSSMINSDSPTSFFILFRNIRI